MVKVIGIGGGSGSGKTTIVRRIAEIVPDFVVIPQDNYYKSSEQVGEVATFNFDHPDAFDTALLSCHLRRLRDSLPVEMPLYDFVGNRRRTETIHLEPKRIVILEGIMVFFHAELRGLIDVKLYVDTPDDIRFIRRLQRDIRERGRTVESVIRQYLEIVRPGHYQFIEPTKAYADLIIPEGGTNESALEVLSSFMRSIS